MWEGRWGCCPLLTSPAPSAPSCLGAEADAPSRRLRTKAAGEEAVRGELGPISTIFKPAAMTGTEDRLFNMYAAAAKRTPFLPLINGGNTRMQPVWVRDVAAGEPAAHRDVLGGPTCDLVCMRAALSAACRWGGLVSLMRLLLRACALVTSTQLPVRITTTPMLHHNHAAIMNSLKTYDAKGQTYHLAGPDVMTVAEQASALPAAAAWLPTVPAGCASALPGTLPTLAGCMATHRRSRSCSRPSARRTHRCRFLRRWRLLPLVSGIGWGRSPRCAARSCLVPTTSLRWRCGGWAGWRGGGRPAAAGQQALSSAQCLLLFLYAGRLRAAQWRAGL